MAIIRDGKYTEDFKTYLTYPAEEKISQILLSEGTDTEYRVIFSDSVVVGNRLPPKLAKELKSMGAKVEKIRVPRKRGRNKLFGIPVEIRQIAQTKEPKSIRVRVTGKTKEELEHRRDTITSGLAKYGIEPTSCTWYGIGGEEQEKRDEEGNGAQTTLAQDEVSKLKNEVMDLKDEFHEYIVKPRMVKIKAEDRRTKFEALD